MKGQRKSSVYGMKKNSHLSHKGVSQRDTGLSWIMFHNIKNMYHDIKNSETIDVTLLFHSFTENYSRSTITREV